MASPARDKRRITDHFSPGPSPKRPSVARFFGAAADPPRDTRDPPADETDPTDDPRSFRALADALHAVGATRSRKAKLAALARYFAATVHDPETLTAAFRLASGAAACGADQAMVQAVAAASATPVGEVRRLVREHGSLAEAVARLCRLTARASLRTAGVEAALRAVEATRERGDQTRALTGLLRRATAVEARFVVAAGMGALRIGATLTTMLDALTGGSAAARRAFNLRPDVELLCASMSAGGVARVVAALVPTPGVPLRPMLARAVAALGEVALPALAERKYDGVRGQIHVLAGGAVRIFSRHMEDLTATYGAAAAAAREAVVAEPPFVIDAELVGRSSGSDGRLLPLQQLQADPSLACVFAFDVVLAGALALPLEARRALLEAGVRERPGRFELAWQARVEDEEELQAALSDAVAAGTEGLVVKQPGSAYEPDGRSAAWAKVKKDYVAQGVADSVDVVPVGAWHGAGRKAGWLSPVLLATLCRCMSGFSDAFYAEFTARAVARDAPHPAVVARDRPDVWLEPNEVWEIRGADITVSPRHTAGLGLVAGSAGLSLRFARFLRVRRVGGIEGVTEAEEVVRWYRAQPSSGPSGGGSAGGSAL